MVVSLHARTVYTFYTRNYIFIDLFIELLDLLVRACVLTRTTATKTEKDEYDSER